MATKTISSPAICGESGTAIKRVAHLHVGKKMCGCATYIFTLMQAMQMRSDYTPVLILLAEGEVSAAAADRGIPYHVLQKEGRLDLRIVVKLSKLFRELEIDILHTHTLNGNFYGRMAALLTPKLKVVTTVHTYVERVIDDIVGGRKLAMALVIFQNNMLGLRNAAFIAASENLRRSMLSAFIPENKSHVVYNGMPLPTEIEIEACRAKARSEFVFYKDDFVIGTALRLVPSKNVGSLLKASAALHASGLSHKLLIIGDGPECQSLTQLAKTLALGDAVIFAGWRKDAASLVAGLDLYVQPSSEENFPYAILEAMAAARPILCYDTGSHREIVLDGHTGYVCDHGDQLEFESKMRSLLVQADSATSMGRHGRERVFDIFSIDGMIDGITSVYDSVANLR